MDKNSELMKELISIVMPVYNCSDYIQDCIKSILLQSYTNWELIIVDDYSTDDTVESISNFSDGRIKLYKNNRNIGLAASLNYCIALATGELIARMDGDDIMTTNRLEVQYNYLANNSNVDVIGGLAYLIDEKNEILGFKKYLKPENFRQLLLFQGIFIHPTIMGKKIWFKKYMYDASIERAQDLELWIRSYDFSNFKNIDEYLIFYREVGHVYKEKYFKVYISLRAILKLHREKMSYFLRIFLILRSFQKYLFFDVLRFFGFIQKKQTLTITEQKQIQFELSKIIL